MGLFSYAQFYFIDHLHVPFPHIPSHFHISFLTSGFRISLSYIIHIIQQKSPRLHNYRLLQKSPVKETIFCKRALQTRLYIIHIIQHYRAHYGPSGLAQRQRKVHDHVRRGRVVRGVSEAAIKSKMQSEVNSQKPHAHACARARAHTHTHVCVCVCVFDTLSRQRCSPR